MPRISKWDTATFVGWDGEGATIDGRHRYLMLRNSEGGGITNVRGLSSRAALGALVDGLIAHPHAWHVGFAFSYDVNMIVGDFPRSALLRLQRGAWAQWRGFRLRFRRAKSLTVQRYDRGEWRGGTVWDTFGFFQQSFVRACESYDVGSPHVREAVAEMKQARSEFRPEDIDAIQSYCESECRLLVALLAKLRGYFGEADLKLARWDGAGAVAASLLQREGVKACKGLATPAVQDAVQFAFAGGRIELIRYGHSPNTAIHHYDLNSAYPAALQSLPCLAHGEWHRAVGPKALAAVERGGFLVARVRWHFEDASGPLFPFFWRAPDGRIFYPKSGEGWYWWPEVAAALDFAHARGESRVEVLDAWARSRACRCDPFRFIPRLFAQRREWKREGRGAEKVLKLGLNSLYGKCAQHVGGTAHDGPPWHQLEWAGYTTSATRAALFRAAWPLAQRGALISLATDGIYATEPIDGLALGGGLGEWSYQQHDGITIAQSGVYWLDDGEQATGYHRGFDPGSIDRRQVVRAWLKGRSSVVARSTRFIGMGQALSGGEQWERWRQWVASPRRLELTPLGTKRMGLLGERRNPGRGLVDTLPYDPKLEGLGEMSTPAALPWRALPGVVPWDEDDQDDAVIT